MLGPVLTDRGDAPQDHPPTSCTVGVYGKVKREDSNIKGPLVPYLIPSTLSAVSLMWCPFNVGPARPSGCPNEGGGRPGLKELGDPVTRGTICYFKTLNLITQSVVADGRQP